MPSCLDIKKHVPSGTIILRRPERRNALSRENIEDLLQAFRDFHLERRVRAVIITGAGETFCGGLDLAEMSETIQSEESREEWHREAMQLKELIDYMLRFPKPIIAAVNGPAIASGAAICLAADLVLGGPQACFQFPEAHWGLVGGLAAPLLHFRLGGSVAAKLLLTCREIDATEAERLGLIHELVPDELLWARAHELAGEIARAAPESIQLIKKMLNETVGEELAVWLSAGAAASAAARTTDAAREGLEAFRQRREPRW